MPTLQFKGKPLVQNHHLVVPFSELEAVKSRGLSKSPSLHDNLIVEGDNLKALKALLPTYHGKIKCIYIDPPYNTGNEGWIYNDKVNSPMIRDWLGKTVDRDDLTRHDKGCCMMLPRLKLLRELLTDTGAIFVSIDDNEVHHLRGLMDEVFGEENFAATVIWQKVFAPKNTAKYFSEDHDFVLVYARHLETWIPNLLERSEQSVQRYQNPDNDQRGVWSSSDITARNYYGAGTYEVTSPSGKKFKPSNVLLEYVGDSGEAFLGNYLGFAKAVFLQTLATALDPLRVRSKTAEELAKFLREKAPNGAVSTTARATIEVSALGPDHAELAYAEICQALGDAAYLNSLARDLGGYNGMVPRWGTLGFVVRKDIPSDTSINTAFVETETSRYDGISYRDYFHILMNIGWLCRHGRDLKADSVDLSVGCAKRGIRRAAARVPLPRNAA